ncbi:hypothetical protein GCM10027063_34080 [Promicromonospora xylanilytica]
MIGTFSRPDEFVILALNLILFASLLAAAIFVVHWLASRDVRRSIRVATLDAGLICSAAFYCLATLIPGGNPYDDRRIFNPIPFRELYDLVTGGPMAAGATDLFGNFVLLMPFAVILPLRWPAMNNIARCIATLAAITVLDETAQYVFAMSRVASFTDAILQTVGGALVCILIVRLRRRAKQRDQVRVAVPAGLDSE